MNYEKLPNRQESRWMLDLAQANDAHARFNALFDHVKHVNPATNTAHLASKELTHPSSYLRIRQYIPTLCVEEFTLDPDDDCFFELKQRSGIKERIQQPLGRILLGTSLPAGDTFAHDFPSAHKVLHEFGQPLMPIFATQSLRSHYQTPGARVTVDEHLSYYGIRWGELHAHRLGALQAVKVELKLEEPTLGGDAAEQFDIICEQLGGTPATDEDTAKNMFAAYQKFIEAA